MYRPASSNSNVDWSGISRWVTVHLAGEMVRNRSEAASYIIQGYRVTDEQAFDLRITTDPDGRRRIVRGENQALTLSDRAPTVGDRLTAFNERNRQRTLERAAAQGNSERPSGLPERELTDYESGRPHPLDCGIANCDHPVHFGGSETGELKSKTPEKRDKDKEDEKRDSSGKKSNKRDSSGGAGGAAV